MKKLLFLCKLIIRSITYPKAAGIYIEDLYEAKIPVKNVVFFGGGWL